MIELHIVIPEWLVWLGIGLAFISLSLSITAMVLRTLILKAESERRRIAKEAA